MNELTDFDGLMTDMGFQQRSPPPVTALSPPEDILLNSMGLMGEYNPNARAGAERFNRARQQVSRMDEGPLTYIARRLPGVGAGFEAGISLRARSAEDRIRAGGMDDEDYYKLAEWERLGRIDASRQPVFEMASRIPAFATDFAVGRGAFTAARGAIAGQVPALAEQVTSRGIAGGLAGVAAHTATQPGLVARNVAERMGPGTNRTFLEALGPGVLDSFIETLSEHSGQVLTERVLPGLARVSGGRALYNRLGGQRVNDWIEEGIISRIPARLRLRGVSENLGYHGLVGEYLEERFGESLRGITMGEWGNLENIGRAGRSAAEGDVEGTLNNLGRFLNQSMIEGAAFAMWGGGMATFNAASAPRRGTREWQFERTRTATAVFLADEVGPQASTAARQQFRAEMDYYGLTDDNFERFVHPGTRQDPPDLSEAPGTNELRPEAPQETIQIPPESIQEDPQTTPSSAPAVIPVTASPQDAPGRAQTPEGGQVPSEVPVTEERRQDAARRRAVAEMTSEEMKRELLTSPVTGLPNRRAFDEAGPAKAVAMSDADGLKAFNDKFGYEAGNTLLRAKAEALKATGLEAYHEKGDEFVFSGESSEAIQTKLERARSLLRESVITVTMTDGTVRRFKGADFSFGVGNDLKVAESGLKRHKSEREAKGERARGELRGITEVGPQPNQEDRSRADQGRAAQAPRHPAQRTVEELSDEWQEFGPHWDAYPERIFSLTDQKIASLLRGDSLPLPLGPPKALAQIEDAWNTVSRLWPEGASRITKVEQVEVSQLEDDVETNAGIQVGDGEVTLLVPIGSAKVSPKTLWHELVHAEQHAQGRLKPTSNRTNAEHIELEREAYARAAQFEDKVLLTEETRGRPDPLEAGARPQTSQEGGSRADPRSSGPAPPVKPSILDRMRRKPQGSVRTPQQPVPRQPMTPQERLMKVFAESGLSAHEQRILKKRISSERPSQEEVGRSMGLTGSRIGQIEADAWGKLPEALRQQWPSVTTFMESISAANKQDKVAGAVDEPAEAVQGEANQAENEYDRVVDEYMADPSPENLARVQELQAKLQKQKRTNDEERTADIREGQRAGYSRTRVEEVVREGEEAGQEDGDAQDTTSTPQGNTQVTGRGGVAGSAAEAELLAVINDPEAVDMLHSVANGILATNKAERVAHNKLVSEIKRVLAAHGTNYQKLSVIIRTVGYYDSIPGFDLVETEIDPGARNTLLGIAGVGQQTAEDPHDPSRDLKPTIWKVLTEGKRDVGNSEKVAYEQALERVLAEAKRHITEGDEGARGQAGGSPAEDTQAGSADHPTEDFFQVRSEQTGLFNNQTKPLVPDAPGGTVSQLGAGFTEADRPRSANEVEGAEKPLEGSPIYNQKTGNLETESGEVLFAGAPIQLTFLDNLLKSSSPSGAVARLFRRWFTSKGDLPAEVFAEKVKSDGRIAAFVQDIHNTEKDLRAAVGPYDKLTTVQIKQMDAALKGDRDAFMSLPGNVQPIIRSMREQVDALTRAMIQNGVIEGPLAAAAAENIGVYLNRSYRVFTDPNWAQKVPADVRNRFKSWLRAERQANDELVTEDELESITNSLLYEGKAAETPIAFLTKSKLGSKDLGVLQRRKDVPAELRALWGEHEDPLINYTNSVGRMSHLLSNHLFLTAVREQGLGKFLFEEPTGPHITRIAMEGSEVMKPLNGLYTTPEIKRAFEEVYAKQHMPAYLRAYMRVLGLAKYAQTVGSVVTHLRNFIGNAGFAVANGHYRINKAIPALKAIATDTTAARDYYRRLLELGVVGDNVNAEEFQSIVKDILGEKDLTAGEAMGMVSDKRIVSWLRKGSALAKKAYDAEDAIWKVYAFENEKARYREAHPEWTDQQLDQRAADIVRTTYPTYSLVPKAVKAARRFPIVAPFVSFPAEVVRTTVRTIQLGVEEMKDPKTRGIGATRLAGISLAVGGMTFGLQMLTRALFGVDPDDEESLRRFMPEWSRNNPILHLGKNDKGEYRFIDLGNSAPHAYLIAPIIAALRGQATSQVGREVARPFISEELVTERLLDIARNRRRDGGQVYNPQAPVTEQAQAVARHIGAPFVPGSIMSARRVMMALTGEPESRTGRTYEPREELVATLTGQRVQAVRLQESLSFRVRAFERSRGDTLNLLTSVLRSRGTISNEDLTGAYRTLETARRRNYDELRRDILAAQELGLTRQQVLTVMRNAELSQSDMVSFLEGSYRPYVPSTQLLQVRVDGVSQNEMARRLRVIRGAVRP